MTVPAQPHQETVKPDWVDYNGHMNVAYYVLAFDHATDTFLDSVGMDAAWRERTGNSVFVVEAHVTYDREVHEGDPLTVHSRPLEVGTKTLRLFHRMEHGTEGFLAATNEVMILHVDMATRRTAPWPDDVRSALESAVAAFDAPWPEQAGRAIGKR
ncbi:thioesterase family protein [Caenispirillum salinarum]|uniref:thioesterase family protein n=1 Tax=Caenispirillum salinarum TaxID=859058 RepID=UPI0005B91474